MTQSHEAVELIVSAIASEAASAGLPLAEVERKMLYFSETEWSLPDMTETAELFERNFDEGEYEAKVASLIGKINQRLMKGSSEERRRWTDSVRSVRQEDRYLTILIDQARPQLRSPYDLLKLWCTGLGVCLAALGFAFLMRNVHVEYQSEQIVFAIWATMAGVALIYLLVSLFNKLRRR